MPQEQPQWPRHPVREHRCLHPNYCNFGTDVSKQGAVRARDPSLGPAASSFPVLSCAFCPTAQQKARPRAGGPRRALQAPTRPGTEAKSGLKHRGRAKKRGSGCTGQSSHARARPVRKEKSCLMEKTCKVLSSLFFSKRLITKVSQCLPISPHHSPVPSGQMASPLWKHQETEDRIQRSTRHLGSCKPLT